MSNRGASLAIGRVSEGEGVGRSKAVGLALAGRRRATTKNQLADGETDPNERLVGFTGIRVSAAGKVAGTNSKEKLAPWEEAQPSMDCRHGRTSFARRAEMQTFVCPFDCCPNR
jgi:hypothetical protein